MKATIERHEKICYRNPNRFCELCENTGKVSNYIDEHIIQEIPCPFCSNFDPKKLKEIEERERKEKEVIEPTVNPDDMLF